MRKVLIYSLLLIIGLIVSQIMPQSAMVSTVIKVATMFALSFIMIHVGYEFEVDKKNPKQYAWDYLVAATAAGFPWIFCAFYFIFAMSPAELWSYGDLWREAFFESRFASPTSAGVLFSMLAAAGLGATWVFGKARILAIFDDLDTILFMIPLQIMMVGAKWQVIIVIFFIGILLWLAWRYLHVIKLPSSWPIVMGYAFVITIVCEGIYIGSKMIDHTSPIHFEVLLPAFCLGCIMARPGNADVHADDAKEGHEEGPNEESEQRVSTIMSACFMILVGLSMPPILEMAKAADHPAPTVAAVPANPAAVAPEGAPAAAPAAPAGEVKEESLLEDTPIEVLHYPGASHEAVAKKKTMPGWGVIALHVLAVTILSNIGKMFPAFCYRKEATLRERIALGWGMFPRGEVGAGVLVISLSYGLAGPSITVAILSLALNLLCTGLFILVVKKLLAGVKKPENAPETAEVQA